MIGNSSVVFSNILLDSVSKARARLTTFEVVYPSTYHAEIVSNRDLSVTAAGGNVVRPMADVRAVISGTYRAFSQFFAKYIGSGSPSALHALAVTMRNQYNAGKPVEVNDEGWHLPYVDFHTVEDCCLIAFEDAPKMGFTPAQLDMAATQIALKISVVRCHIAELRVCPIPGSRERHAARMAWYHDLLNIYQELLAEAPLSSAFEHQGQPDYFAESPFEADWANESFHGNFVGWQQHRRLFIEPALSSHAFNLAQQEKLCG